MLRWIAVALALGSCAQLRAPPEPIGSAQSSIPTTATDALRVLVWNVSRESFFANIDDFRRVLQMLDADVLILDEMPNTGTRAQLAEALGGLGDPAQPWSVVYGSSGGRERSAIASQRPLTRLSAFDNRQYTDQVAAPWLAALTDPTAKDRLQRELRSGLSLVGAQLSWRSRRLLIAGLDFQCCGNGGNSWEESRRRYEAQQLQAVLSSAVAEQQPAGTIVGGDFNAVNGPAPLMIAQGEEGSAAHLRIVEALQLDGNDRWTWDGRGTPFASGRLDYQMHSQGLTVVSAFVLELDDLSTAERRRWQLESLHMTDLTEHRPVVVDYRWTD